MDTLPEFISDYVTHTLPTMDGWCTKEKSESLVETVFSVAPKVCVEIGVYAGRSLFAIALALKHLGSGYILGIDPWNPGASTDGTHNPADRDWWMRLDHSAIYQKFCGYRTRLGVEGCTEIFAGTSTQAAPFLQLVSRRYHGSQPFIDLLHIDGNHSTEHAVADVEAYLPLVVPGGTVYFDDLSWATTKPAQVRLEELCKSIGKVTDCGIYVKRR